ncbi:hypothetical protein DH2020_002312 [Rehmannia glutinosa]|uniref:Peptidyl-prolyl cis-trans isomerase n=1 Tax=Rehmannia glutinosa TaxID=99300 RepID=A0ABR0XTB4_REHGL
MSVTLHTNLGDIKCEIFCDEVPKTAENFLALSASGYYDGTIFHRNIKGFMIQGGDPTNTGKGGTSIWGKKFNDEIRESLKHNARGMLSMANSGPNTNGSQFFITYAKQPHLNGLYTIFGKVIHGFEVLDIMEKAPTGPGDRPLMEIRINRVTIHANPLAGLAVVYKVCFSNCCHGYWIFLIEGSQLELLRSLDPDLNSDWTSECFR